MAAKAAAKAAKEAKAEAAKEAKEAKAAEAKAAKMAKQVEAEAARAEEEETYVLPSQEAVATSEDAPAEPETQKGSSEPVVELSHEEKVFRSGALFLEQGRVAVSMLQRNFEMDFQEATGILDELQSMGLIGPYLGGTRRDILMTTEEWEALGAAR